MPRTPIVEQTVQTNALPNARFGSSLRPVENPYDDSAARAQQKFVDAIGQVAEKAKQRGDDVALIDAQRKVDEWEAVNLSSQSGAFSKKGKDALGLPVQYGGQFDKDMQGIKDTLSNADQQLAFDKIASSRRGTVIRTLYEHERNQMNDYAKQTTDAAVESSINRGALFYSRPEIVDSAIRNAQDAFALFARDQGMPDEAIDNKMLEIESKTRLGALTRMADESPKAAIDYYNANLSRFDANDLLSAQRLLAPVERKYKAQKVAMDALTEAVPRVSRDDIVDFVIHDLEGGDKLATDSNKGKVKFGINAKANPDIDVKNLDEAGAREIAVERYWKKIGGDELPMDMRLPALSFAFTSGTEPTKKLLEESGNDPRKFIELSGKFYQDLARKNPDKHGASLQGWMNRLAKVQAQVDLARGQQPSEFELSKKIDAAADNLEVAEDAKTLVSKYLKGIEESRKATEKAASDEAWKYKQGGMEVPTSVEARMSPKEAVEMRDKSEPDPELHNDLRNRILLGQDVDLPQYRWRLGGKYEDLLQLQGDPTKRSQTRTIADITKNANGILLGKASPRSQGDYERLDRFERQVSSEIDAYQKTSGKIAGADEVQKITDRLLLTVDPKGLNWSDSRLGELEPGTEYEVDGIPKDRKLLVGGTEQTYDSIIRKLSGSLSKRGRQVTPEAMTDLYNELVTRKAIVEKYDQ